MSIRKLLAGVAFSCSTIALSVSAGESSKEDPPEPVFEDIQITFLESVRKGSLSRAAVSGRLSEINGDNLKSFIGNVFTIEDDSGELVNLRDDGLGGDARARDGVFHAEGLANPGFVLSRADRIAKAKENKQEAVSLQFNGREIVGIKAAEETALSLSPFVPLNLPLGGISGVINEQASLLINNANVVQDPNLTFNACTGVGTPGAPWTFRYLMEQMANTPQTGVTASEFTSNWLNHWRFDQVVNNFTVPNRSAGVMLQILDDWIEASGGPGQPLDLDLAPFRLLAIVNRVDLRSSSVYGGGSAGEGRFVFGLIDPDTCSGKLMTVIFEYGIGDNMSCRQVKNWGQQWVDLANHVIGSPAYNAALLAITSAFVDANTAPGKPNGSSLNQLRTNEIALASPWELREFVISASSHHLGQDTVKQTPDNLFNNTSTLFSYVNSNTPAIVNEVHQVPLNFPTAFDPFLGGNSLAPTPGFEWTDGGGSSPPIVNREARHKFSLNTCNGCHADETDTFFTHVIPQAGIPAPLSGFLTGISVNDPVDGTPTRLFGDLARRAADLDDLVSSSCLVSGVHSLQAARRSALTH